MDFEAIKRQAIKCAMRDEMGKRFSGIRLSAYDAREKIVHGCQIEDNLLHISLLVNEIRELESKLYSLKAEGE